MCWGRFLLPEMKSDDANETTDAVPDESEYKEKEPKPGVSQPSYWEEKSEGDNENKDFGRNFKKDKTNIISQNLYGCSKVYNISSSTNVHIGANNVVNYGMKYKTPKKKQTKWSQTDKAELKKLCSSLMPVTISHIQLINSIIGDKWKAVGRSLGYQDGQLEQFKADYHPQKEAIHKMLLQWIQANPNIATVGNLCESLCDAGEIDAAMTLCKKLKTS